MSRGLLEQLGIYGEDFDAGLPPVTLDELDDMLWKPVGTGAVRPLQPHRSRRPLGGWVYATAAAVVVLLFVGGALLLFRVVGSETPVATTPLTDDLSSLRWSRVPHDEAIFYSDKGGQELRSVTAGGPGLVAVGGLVMTSVDGIAWSRVPDDGVVFGGAGGAVMDGVTVGGPGLVAVGQAGVDEPVAVWSAAVWTSVDGITWSRVPHDEAIFGGEGEQEMNAVTVGGPGLVAVGTSGVDEPGAVAAVWTSVDGVTWSRVPHDEAVFGGEGATTMGDVTVGGPGLVAVGTSGVDQAAAVWTSVDGITWSRVPHDEAVFGGEGEQAIDGVTVGGPGLVAVGADDSDAAVWTSVDGITWSRVPHDESVFGEPGILLWMADVTATGSGLVAVGFQQPGAQPSDSEEAQGYITAVWTSTDGITWSRVPHSESVFGEGEMLSVTVGGPGLVAVGMVGSPYYGPVPPHYQADYPAVWVAVPEE